MKIRAVTESTCHLPANVISQYCIEFVPHYTHIDDQQLLDGVNISNEAFNFCDGAKMKRAKLMALLGLLAMSAARIYGFSSGDFQTEGNQLLAMPWGIVSLVDLYTGFILVSGWIFYREKLLATTIVWAIAMMVLGFLAGIMYVLLALITGHGGWHQFWLGKHANQNA